jgi:hypothetical protein
MKLNYILAAVEKHGIHLDDDVKTLENSFRM